MSLQQQQHPVVGHRPNHGGAMYRGLARVLIDTIGGLDQEATSIARSTLALAKSNWKPNRAIKSTDMIAVQQHFNRIPLYGSVFRQGSRSRDGLALLECRLSKGSLHADAWEDADSREPGLTIEQLLVQVTKKVCTVDLLEIGFVGMHALSRWYARARDTSHAGFMRNMLAIYKARDSIIDSHLEYKRQTFRIPDSTDGAWLGTLVSCTRHFSHSDKTMEGTVLRVQTYSTD